jgi:hypothetical protein
MTAPAQVGDMMVCRACDTEQRPSEGYPCVDCGTFICIICEIRGVIRCRKCQAASGAAAAASFLK